MKETRLSDVVIQPSLGVVLVDGKERPLKPKAMAVLELLAQNPGKLLSKRKLVDTVWGAAVVTDEVLTQAIYEIRQALKGSAASDMIRTVPRRGYILQTATEAQSSPERKPSHHWGLAFATLVIAIALLAWFNRPQTPGEITDRAEPAREANSANSQEQAISALSLAVLPFKNRSALEEDEFFAGGIHDDLLSTISKIGAIKVISRTSVMEYKDSAKKIPIIAEELGVANILEGSIQRSGDQVRINVQLINAKTDEHLWAEIYDRELTARNLFTIQSEISRSIADALQTVLSEEEENRINRMPTDNLQAYDAYLRGRQLMETRKVANLQQAIEAFRKATETDPQFALAWVGFADANDLLSNYSPVLPKETAIPIMEDAIARAMAIDDQLGEAYVSQANIHTYYQRFDEAEAAFQKAIELSPNYATAYHWYSNFVFDRSRLRVAEATSLAKKAFELDPRSLILGVNLASHYQYGGLYSLAERQFLNLIEINPEFANPYIGLAEMYLINTGQFDKAVFLLRKASQLEPMSPFLLLRQIETFQQLGDVESMQEVRTGIAAITGEDSWLVGVSDIWISLALNDSAATTAEVNKLLPKIENNQYFKDLMGPAELVFGHTNRARELFLDAWPGWLIPDQWSQRIHENPRYACLASWVLINSGDEALGTQLLQQTTTFLDEVLPAFIEHPDNWMPDVCYLASGDTEKALLSMETQFAHGHLQWRDLIYRMPMYDSIRNEPRFLAVLEKRAQRIATQRAAVAQMNSTALP